ncbi:MAG: hypothetical protein JWM95_1650 [Gemmatimonadetes bacterium]|nr:hypothetical protein [Gemmatimonadota bacterium]
MTPPIATLFEIVDSADWQRLDEVFHPDIVYERPGYPPFTGIAAVRLFYSDIRQIDAGRHEMEGLVITDSAAACWGTFRGVLKNGSESVERFADAYVLSHESSPRVLWRRSHFFRAAI